MSKLEDFLALNDVSEIRKTITVNVNGKKLDLVIRPVTDEEHKEMQKRSYIYNKNKVTFDTSKYTESLLTSCIVEPNFNNAEFLSRAKCTDAYEFLNKKFSAGVLSDISNEIQKLSGFESLDVEIEEAKN